MSVRRVAVLGGNRIPFARSNSAYAHASNHDMLTAALDGLVDRFGLEGELLGEVAAGAVLKHPRDRDLTREAVLEHAPGARDARLRRPAGVRHGPGGRGAGGEQDRARARSTRGSRGASDTTSDAPIALNEDLRKLLLDLNRTRSTRPAACACSRACARARSCPRYRATPSRARACRWASTARSWPANGASRAPSRTSWPRAATSAWPPPTSAASSPTCSPLIEGLERDQNLRADSTPEKLAQAAARLRRARRAR